MTRARLRVATLGAATSANKGAAAMLQALMTTLPDVVGPCHFDVLTTYPDEDRREPPRVPDGSTMTIVPCRPWELVFPILPLALLVGLSRQLGIHGRWLCVVPSLRALVDADIVIDLAGISFSDGRGLPLLTYNTLMTGTPVLVGCRVVKAAQALGPFDETLNRFMAKRVLSRMAAVIARGDRTEGHLHSIGLGNVHRAADLAYVLPVVPEAIERADRIVEQAFDGRSFTGVVPSNVVRKHCEREDIPYEEITADFIRRLNAHGTRVLLIPHAARPGHRGGHMNDLSLARRIHEAVATPDCHLVGDSLSPEVLRRLVGRAEFLVTARFHGLISALSTTTPPLVIGWSHKYREALSEFALSDWLVDFRNLDAGSLFDSYQALREEREKVEQMIERRHPEVASNAERNLAIIKEVLSAEMREDRR